MINKPACMRINGDLQDYQLIAKDFNTFVWMLGFTQEININPWLLKWQLMRLNN